MRKTIFFHMNQLGDLLFSLPVLAAARREWADQRIVSVVRPQLAALLKATGLVDEVIARPKGGIGQKLQLVRALRREKFDQAILFSEAPEVVLSAFASGIPKRLGFATASLGFLLTDTIGRTGVPSLKNNFNLGSCAGLKNIPAHYAGLVKVPQSEMDAMGEWLRAGSIDVSSLVVISPGASKRRAHKFWLAERWVSLLSTMLDHQLSPVLAGAPSEKEALEELARGFDGRVKVFTAPGGILSLAALLRSARVFVGIDSGAMHLAAGLQRPCVGLFGPTDPQQIGPQPLSEHVIVKRDAMQDIRVEEVWAGIEQQLAKGQ